MKVSNFAGHGILFLIIFLISTHTLYAENPIRPLAVTITNLRLVGALIKTQLLHYQWTFYHLSLVLVS